MKKIICIGFALSILNACVKPDVIVIHNVKDVNFGAFGTSNAKIGLLVDIENKGRSGIVVREFNLNVYEQHNPKPLLGIKIPERVEFRRRSRGVVEIPFVLNSGNGILGMASSLKRIQNHDPALRVSFELNIRKGAVSKRIVRKDLTIDQCIEALSHINLNDLQFLSYP